MATIRNNSINKAYQYLQGKVKGDLKLWGLVIVFAICSIFVVYSSTGPMAYREAGGDTSHYVLVHSLFWAVGLIVMFFVHLTSPVVFLRLSKLFLIFSLALVVLAFIPPFAAPINGAYRWVRLPGLPIPPFLASEPLKITLVMYLASMLGKYQLKVPYSKLLPSFLLKDWRNNRHDNANILKGPTFYFVFPIFLSVGLVMLSSLTTALIVFVIGLVMLLAARVRWREIGRILMLAFVGMLMLFLVLFMFGVGRAETWINRIGSFVTPTTLVEDVNGVETEVEDKFGSEYQRTQAQIAIASGGLIGKGPGKSTQRTLLPHPYSDFSYAFIVEEYGVAGAFFIMLFYLVLFYRTIVIAKECRSNAEAMLVVGLTIAMLIPAFINMAVSVGLFPVTGQSLPFISYGGSSLMFNCFSMGLILGVSRKNQKMKQMDKANALAMVNGDSDSEELCLDGGIYDYGGEDEDYDYYDEDEDEEYYDDSDEEYYEEKDDYSEEYNERK